MREWLKSARERRGLTMKAMSEALGISESYYSLIEAGERQKRLDFSLVVRLATVLEMSLQTVAENEDARKGTQPCPTR